MHFELKDEFTVMLRDFGSMLHAFLSRMNIAKHQVELLTADTRAFHSAPYRVRAIAREFEMKQNKENSLEELMEPAPTVMAASIVFSSRKTRFLCFSVGHWKLNDEPKCEGHPISGTCKCINSFGKAAVFSALDANIFGTGIGNWQVHIATKN